MNLDELNQLSNEAAEEFFVQCCTASSWIKKMINSRPYATTHDLVIAANENWQGLDEADYLEAFEGHPKIGNVNSLRKKYGNTKQLASGEQSLVNQASEKLLGDLAKGNDDYFNKFGFIFIVCATGKTALQMLNLLEQRLINDRALELIKAAEEQRKIFLIRLDKCLENKV
ncbi:MAG: OHCU decarboxylase [Gammaproteobacteria bacterium]|nr:MAG: OHCU decarboxylase [Gammaproteobacteria bacterium]